MLKSKLFIGKGSDLPDAKFNRWMEDHPGVTIKDFRCMATNNEIYGICILYERADEIQALSLFKATSPDGIPIYINMNAGEFVIMRSKNTNDGIDASRVVSDFLPFKALNIEYDGDIIHYDSERRVFTHRTANRVYTIGNIENVVRWEDF